MNISSVPKFLQQKESSTIEDEDDEDLANRKLNCFYVLINYSYISNENKKGNPDFEAHRKAHYNEFKMAKVLQSQLKDDDEEGDDGMREASQKSNNDAMV